MSDIQIAYKTLKNDYEKAFCTAENRKKYCPIKKVDNLKRIDKVSVERRTVLPATTINGNYGEKIIYVNDETGAYTETVFVDIEGKRHTFENQGITTFRCGLMTCIAISQFINRMKLSFDKVGFIGCGRTNQSNCRAIAEIFGIKRAVIRGSDRNYGKNLNKFQHIVPTEVDSTASMDKLNQCDIVVVCTSNFEKKNLINKKVLCKPKLFIVLDCGYTLDESFRQGTEIYTDYVEQINSDYDDEFPFDKRRYDLKQLVECTEPVNGTVCVYLHGVGFADITIAEMKARKIISKSHMADRYTKEDCKKLRELMIDEVSKTISNGKPNYVLLSGGLDSVTALYALMETGADFQTVTFYFKDLPSSDKESVERLQRKIGFNANYIEIPNEWDAIKDNVKSAIEDCCRMYRKVREVKVQTIFALNFVDRFLPDDCNVITGANGDGILGYNKTMAIMAAHYGEESYRLIRCRKAEDEPDEFERIFNRRHIHKSVYSGNVQDFLLQFTMRACNKPQPKSIVAYAFEDYHKKYQSYRTPRPFQKASNEKSMFNVIAYHEGYKGALQMFNAMHKEAFK